MHNNFAQRTQIWKQKKKWIGFIPNYLDFWIFTVFRFKLFRMKKIEIIFLFSTKKKIKQMENLSAPDANEKKNYTPNRKLRGKCGK